MKVQEVIRILEENGWFPDKKIGENQLFSNPKKGDFILPLNEEKKVLINTLTSILQKIGRI